MKEKLMEQLRAIENQLSPENLTCDGEADPRWVRREFKRLHKERAKIIAQLGYEPTIDEIYPEFKVHP
jgi:hypothetical protein